MKTKPNLKNAYDLKSPSDNIELYSSWADTYDLDFIDEMQYELHFHVANAFVSNGGRGLILDVGAGTGALAEALLNKAKFTIEELGGKAELIEYKKEKVE